MKLSIVIVAWNSGQVIEKTLQSLFCTKADFEFEVFVVDNNSEDETVEIVREGLPQVHLIENEANYGFSKAVNQIIRQVETDKVLILAPGVLLGENVLADALSWMEQNKQATVLACGLLDEGSKVVNFGDLPGFFDLIGQKRQKKELAQPKKVGFVSKDFFLINKKNIRDLKFFGDRTLPEFDDRFFLGYEDIDYCQQIEKAGGEVWFLPQITCQTSLHKVESAYRKQKKQNKKKSKIEYAKKWQGFFGQALVKVFR